MELIDQLKARIAALEEERVHWRTRSNALAVQHSEALEVMRGCLADLLRYAPYCPASIAAGAFLREAA